MSRSGAAVALTAALVVALAAALGWCALALGRAALLEAEGLWTHRDDLRFDDLVLAGALGVLGLCSGWLVLGIALTLGTRALRSSHTVAGRLARAITPSLVRSLLGGACGAAVLVAPTPVPGAFAVPAEAGHPQTGHPQTGHPQSGHPQTPDCPGRLCSDVLGGLPVPDRPWGARVASRTTRSEPERVRVRVRPGDSLWAIAAQHLTAPNPDAEPLAGRHPPHRPSPPSRPSPPGRTEIAAAWPRWFDLNRARIGDDPDLIRPGTRLVIPQRFR